MKNFWINAAAIILAVGLFSGESFAGGKSKGSAKKSSDAKSGKSAKGKSSKTSGEGKKPSQPEPAAVGEAQKKTKITVLGVLGYSLAEKGLAFGGSLGTQKANGSGVDLGLTYSRGTIGIISAARTHFSGRYRQSVMGKGFVAGGLGFSMLSGEWLAISEDQTSESPGSASVKVVTIGGAIGLRLPLGGFVVGADLIDFSYQIMKMGLQSKRPEEAIYDVDADAQQANFNKYAGGALIMSKLAIGIAF